MTEESDGARFRLLYDLGCGFAARIELEELLPFIIQKCRDVLDAEGVSVLLLDRDHNEFYFPYMSDLNSVVARRLAPVRFRADLGIAGVVLHRAVRAKSTTRNVTLVSIRVRTRPLG